MDQSVPKVTRQQSADVIKVKGDTYISDKLTSDAAPNPKHHVDTNPSVPVGEVQAAYPP